MDGVVYPTRRAAPLSPSAIKASAGATEHMLLAPVDDLAGALVDLRGQGLRIVGADENASLDYSEADLRGPLAIVVGSEGRGIPGPVRKRLDMAVRIPMRGKIASLNASVAGSLLLFAAAAQRPDPVNAPAERPEPAPAPQPAEPPEVVAEPETSDEPPAKPKRTRSTAAKPKVDAKPTSDAKPKAAAKVAAKPKAVATPKVRREAQGRATAKAAPEAAAKPRAAAKPKAATKPKSAAAAVEPPIPDEPAAKPKRTRVKPKPKGEAAPSATDDPTEDPLPSDG